MDDLVKAMGAGGMSKSQVSRLCVEIDERVNAFLSRPLEGAWPYLCAHSGASGRLFQRHPVSHSEVSGHPEMTPLSVVT